MEIWKDIKGYEGLYQISNKGNVMSLNYKNTGKSKLLKQILSTNGYLYIKLPKNGTYKNINVHRLVAEAFLENPDNLPCVNHKDECKTNNNVSNLEFCTYKYNLDYSGSIDNVHINNKKPILQFTKLGEFVAEFNGLIDAQNKTGIQRTNISSCCRGKLKSAGGYIWKFKSPL